MNVTVSATTGAIGGIVGGKLLKNTSIRLDESSKWFDHLGTNYASRQNQIDDRTLAVGSISFSRSVLGASLSNLSLDDADTLGSGISQTSSGIGLKLN